MIKWIWRILYFIVVLFVGLQIFGFGQVQQLSTYYNENAKNSINSCLLYTSPSPRDAHESRMPSSA